MRLLPGQPADIAGESITSYSLINAAVNKPDVLPRVWQTFQEEETPLSSILSQQGLVAKGLYDGVNSSRYRVVKSNHVMYPIKNTEHRIPKIVKVDGKTFICDAYPTKPGFRQSPFFLYLNSNWARPKEVLELDDNDTQLYIYDPDEPKEVTINGGTAWRYEVKLVTGERENYVDAALLAEGAEVGVVSNLYEHDFSETGSEKYTYDGWGHAFMTLQRVKMSYSGTAAAMGADKTWYAFQNAKGQTVNSYIDMADRKMWKRAAEYHEYQTIHGKGTVTIDGETILKDKRNRDIMAGDGIIHQGEGAYEHPYNKWSKRFLEALLKDAYIRSGKDGKQSLSLIGGWECTLGFSNLMSDLGFKTQDNNVEGMGADKGVNMDYSWYEIGGVRIYVRKYRYFDSAKRPNKQLTDGTSKGSWDGVLVPLGLTDEGENGVELVQLRPPKSGQVDGINVGGSMATSVDGSSRHVLVQSGVISRVKIQRIFRPYTA